MQFGKFEDASPTQLVTHDELAELLGWGTAQAVTRAVHNGELPPPIGIGRKRVFVVGVVRDYVIERARVLANRVVSL